MDNNLNTEEVFDSAVSIVRNLPKDGPIKPSDELKLKFYSYYKQATHGPNDTPKPRFYQIVEVYKWDAWRKLGGMSKEEAMMSYIRELKQVMDTIPEEEADVESSKHFEDVLGKKFYDYWFGEWRRSSNRKQLAPSISYVFKVSSSEHKITKSNDTQSNSSGGSSMSMLEDTQSAGDGYKTPNSGLVFNETTFESDARDQFALAVLRLQHGLDETNTRINNIEGQMQQIINRISALENQTYVKQSAIKVKRVSSQTSDLLSMLRNIKTIHWFYLSYPFLVYFIIGASKRKNRNSSLYR